MIMATQVRVKREESKGDLETKLNVVDEEERRLDFVLHYNIAIVIMIINIIMAQIGLSS